MGSRSSSVLALVFPALLFATPLLAQPRQSLADPVARPGSASIPGVLLSPEHSKLLLMEQTAATGEAAGRRTYSALIVQPIGRGETRRLILPWKARVKGVFWSPDGDRVGFTIQEEHGTSLWVGDAYSGVIRMLAGPVLHSSGGEPCQWLHSGESLLCTRTPVYASDSGAVQASPESQESQLVIYPVSGSERSIGAPANYGEISISPDGKYLVVEKRERTPGTVRTEVWDAANGAVLRAVTNTGLTRSRSSASDAVVPGPRSLEWRGDKPATLVWAEAQDGGNPATPAKVRDRLYQLESPFSGVPAPFADLEFRSRGIVWGGNDLAVVSESWSEPRKARSWIVKPDRGGAPRLLQGTTGRGAEAGSFLTRQKRDGGEVLLTAREGRVAYLLGSEKEPGGDRSYMDEIDLATGKTLRIWRSQAPFREEIVGVVDAEEGRFITRRESDTQTQNYFLRDLKKQKLTALTSFR